MIFSLLDPTLSRKEAYNQRANTKTKVVDSCQKRELKQKDETGRRGQLRGKLRVRSPRGVRHAQRRVQLVHLFP